MFKTLNEEQYLEVVDFSKQIYRKEIIKNNDISSPNLYFGLKRGRADYAYTKNKDKFETNEEKLIFKLNLIIANNDLFAETLLNTCENCLNEQDINRITRSFLFRKLYLSKEWNEVINYMIKMYCVTETVITAKICEILSFSNIYYPQLENDQQGMKKSLSK